MPLTPQDVHSKVFGPTRFRRGYDEAEVDAFLDEVEAELTRLHREIDSLRAQLGGEAGDADIADTSSLPPVGADEPEPGGAIPATPAAGAARSAAQSVGQGQDGGSVEQQVARALVLAQRAADEAVREAEAQAEQLRRTASGDAERLRAETAEQIERERRELERQRIEAEDDVEQLRAFEREYRTRLRAYLELQLRELDEARTEVEGRQPGALAGGASGQADHGDWPSEDGQGRFSAGAATVTSMTSGNGLPTNDLPSDDPASVPSVASPSDGSTVPPSVAVADYTAGQGIDAESAGDELRHERRDLHDGL